MKPLYYTFFLVTLAIIASCRPSGTSDQSYEVIKNAFTNPPDDARPKTYWWCLNGNIDTLTAKEELRAMKEVGLTGYDLFEIGVQKHDTMIPGGPAFMSDESLQLIRFAVDEAQKLGLTVGLNLSSSWNAGGSWVKPEHAGKSLYYSKIEITGNSADQKLKIPFPEISFPQASLIGGTGKQLIPFQNDGKPEYYEEIAVLAIPTLMERLDTAAIIDVTHLFDPVTEELQWNAPPGKWKICRYVCSNSGQQLVLPSPLSTGLTIDHFDADAVESHLMYIINRLQSVLGNFETTALKSFYLASYEARGLVWTSTLPDVFHEINGYGIRKLIPAFFNPELFEREINEKMQTDFKKTLSELIINNLYAKAQEICSRYGLKINSEAGGPGYPLYNGPAEPLKAQGAIDIPRGEFWINHSRFYEEKNDTIDILRVVKETSAASHIYEKGVVEMEAFTSFMHWQEGPSDMKPFADRAFCEGMNRVVFHGFSHNISGSGFPGYVYHAGTHFNNKRVWWSKAKPFVDYLSRISAVFQQTDFKADVLWYYGDKIPNAARPKNSYFRVGNGYDYEVINTEVLLERLTLKNGELTLTNGARFSLLVLEDEGNINSSVLKKLNELVENGAVVLGEKPLKVDGVVAKGESKELIERLWGNKPIELRNSRSFEKRIFSGITALNMLQTMGIEPDIDYSGNEFELIDFIHFGKKDVEVYFLRNTQNEWISRSVRFRQQDKLPEIWNPVSGEITPVSIYRQENKYINIPISLPPYGSMLVVFSDRTEAPHFTALTGDEIGHPIIEYTSNGVKILDEGNFKLTGLNTSIIPVNNKISTVSIEGPWNVSFDTNWGAPEKVIFSDLISWTESEIDGIKYYSGIASYENKIHINEKPKKENESIFIDLGKISKVADVWLNGEHLGISWTAPHRFEVTDILREGENIITVEIANTWSNRLTGDALTGENFTNSNINVTIVPAPTIQTGDKTRYSWREVPLIESGLLGPVTIQTIKAVNLTK